MGNERERVRAGVELLDRKLPGWWRKIDLTTLDIGSGSRCVCGQLDGGCWAVLAYRLLEGDKPSSHGFAAEHSWLLVRREYHRLTGVWKEEISARRAAADAETTEYESRSAARLGGTPEIPRARIGGVRA